jgi:hypothetical protein
MFPSVKNTGALSLSEIKSAIGGDTTEISLLDYAASGKFMGGNPNVALFPPVKLGSMYGAKRKLINGLFFRMCSGYFAENTAYFETYKETQTGKVMSIPNITIGTNGLVPEDNTMNGYSVEWFGYFCASETGTWTFYTVSDDASFLWIGPTAISGYTTANALVANQGVRTAVAEVSATIELVKGTYYPIRIQYGDSAGNDDCAVSFKPPTGVRTTDGTGYYFTGIGADVDFPALHPKYIKAITNTGADGTYHILVNGVSTPTYCLMDSKWDGGGWMLMMKATRGGTFSFNSGYWTNSATTLNPTDLTLNDADAKYNACNHAPVNDVMALWPDVGRTGGSIAQTDTWSWLVRNYFNGTQKATILTGFSTTHRRDSPVSPDPTTFSGFSSAIWSSQTPDRRHVFGGAGHLGSTSAARWGFVWNENGGNFSSSDAVGGIGMTHNWNGQVPNYSAGDFYGCCGAAGQNRTMRVQLFGR